MGHEEGVTGQLVHIDAILLTVDKTAPYKGLSFRCDYWFRGKLHICCLQYGVFLQNVLLGLVVAKGLESKENKCY